MPPSGISSNNLVTLEGPLCSSKDKNSLLSAMADWYTWEAHPFLRRKERWMGGECMRGKLGGGTVMKGGRENVVGWEMIN